jgi:hypothetical protein
VIFMTAVTQFVSIRTITGDSEPMLVLWRLTEHAVMDSSPRLIMAGRLSFAAFGRPAVFGCKLIGRHKQLMEIGSHAF